MRSCELQFSTSYQANIHEPKQWCIEDPESRGVQNYLTLNNNYYHTYKNRNINIKIIKFQDMYSNSNKLHA